MQKYPQPESLPATRERTSRPKASVVALSEEDTGEGASGSGRSDGDVVINMDDL